MTAARIHWIEVSTTPVDPLWAVDSSGLELSVLLSFASLKRTTSLSRSSFTLDLIVSGNGLF